MSWETFLKAHWGAIAATDFFSVEVLTRSGLVRYFVLFVIDLKTRRIGIAGILTRPNGEWMKQIARNLTDCEDGFLNGSRHLIHDRDPLFTKSFREILNSSGVETVKLPARSPNLDAYAEASTPCCEGIHRALSHRTESSGTRQSADREAERRG
jgi:putative transposase